MNRKISKHLLIFWFLSLTKNVEALLGSDVQIVEKMTFSFGDNEYMQTLTNILVEKSIPKSNQILFVSKTQKLNLLKLKSILLSKLNQISKSSKKQTLQLKLKITLFQISKIFTRKITIHLHLQIRILHQVPTLAISKSSWRITM